MRKFLFCIAFLILAGCAVNGKHMYVDGRCVSCWNELSTGKPVENEILGANHLVVLSWFDLAITQLREEGVSDTAPYAMDLVRIKADSKNEHLPRNEITLRQSEMQAQDELKSLLQEPRLENRYQLTLPSVLGDYDFEDAEFPVRKVASLSLESTANGVKTMPQNIEVGFTNFNELPNWEMTEEQAEVFLNARIGRHIYVRYILSDITYLEPERYSAKVAEIQFIDIQPSVTTARDKEKHAPAYMVALP